MKKLAFFVLAGLMVLSACATAPATPHPSTQSPTVTPLMEISGDLNFVTQGGPHIIPATETPAQIKPDVPTPALGTQATGDNVGIGFDDNGQVFIIDLATVISENGIVTPNGLKNLAIKFEHPDRPVGRVWWTNEGLPLKVRQVQLMTTPWTIPSINFCLGQCSINETPIWEGWERTEDSIPAMADLAKAIDELRVYFPAGNTDVVVYDYIVH